MVLLPAPLAPTKAIVSPAGTFCTQKDRVMENQMCAKRIFGNKSMSVRKWQLLREASPRIRRHPHVASLLPSNLPVA